MTILDVTTNDSYFVEDQNAKTITRKIIDMATEYENGKYAKLEDLINAINTSIKDSVYENVNKEDMNIIFQNYARPLVYNVSPYFIINQGKNQ